MLSLSVLGGGAGGEEKKKKGLTPRNRQHDVIWKKTGKKSKPACGSSSHSQTRSAPPPQRFTECLEVTWTAVIYEWLGADFSFIIIIIIIISTILIFFWCRLRRTSHSVTTHLREGGKKKKGWHSVQGLYVMSSSNTAPRSGGRRAAHFLSPPPPTHSPTLHPPGPSSSSCLPIVCACVVERVWKHAGVARPVWVFLCTCKGQTHPYLAVHPPLSPPPPSPPWLCEPWWSVLSCVFCVICVLLSACHVLVGLLESFLPHGVPLISQSQVFSRFPPPDPPPGRPSPTVQPSFQSFSLPRREARTCG